MKDQNHFFQNFSLRSFMAGVICSAAAAAAICLLYFALPSPHSAQRPDSMAAFKKVTEIEQLIRARYIDVADEKQQTDAMLKGLVAGLDDAYADYYTKEEHEEIVRSNSGLTKGIGITISQDVETGVLVIIDVSEGMPAEEAGLQVNDILLSINGKDMSEADSMTAAQEIQLSDGPVTVEVWRDGEAEPLSFTMEKTDMKVLSVDGMMLDGEIGYIQIRTFNGVTSEQFAEEYASLREQNMKGLILDLRNNLGGLVTACCDTVSQILPAGPIVFEQDRTGSERRQDCAGESPIDIPLVLLVNGYTASASEIFTGAVRDYGIATIIGEQTYGKGIEQNTYTLSDGSALKLTTTVYYTPEHEDINGVGITPDIIVELPSDAQSDLQFDKAVEVVQDAVLNKK